jgi:hypothetical protein
VRSTSGAVVGEHFLGGPIGGDAGTKNLQDQCRGLAGVETEADEEPAVVIEERDEVDAAVLPLDDEREEVSLPELVGAGALEVTDLVRVRPGGGLVNFIARFVKGMGHRLGAGGQRRSAEQHVADAFASPVGVSLLEQEDGPFGQLGEPASLAGAARLFHEAGRSELGEPLLPEIEGVLGDAHQGSEISRGQAAALPAVEDHEPLLGVVGRCLLLPGPGQPPAPPR